MRALARRGIAGAATEYHGEPGEEHEDIGNGGGSGGPPAGGGPGSDYPPDWDSTRAPLTPEQLDSLFRALGEPDSLRERMVETYRRVWERGQDSSGASPCGGPHRAPCEAAACESQGKDCQD